ncbi:MAG: hypothetical protein E3K36_03545 [Candidatus Brocadia sp.]|nr:hypothetical protein [Candidatus Brocadia sp.]
MKALNYVLTPAGILDWLMMKMISIELTDKQQKAIDIVLKRAELLGETVGIEPLVIKYKY